jgi:hypothetical protein
VDIIILFGVIMICYTFGSVELFKKYSYFRIIKAIDIVNLWIKMYQRSIILLLFLFFTQSVLAGLDLHYHSASDGIKSGQSIDIIEHSIDAHYISNNVDHSCDTQTDNSVIDNADSVTHANHHHDCHGHTTSCAFSSNNNDNLSFTSFYTHFYYTLNDYFINLTSPQRPPIRT